MVNPRTFVVTGELRSFVTSRITEEVCLTLSSTDYVSNKLFLYPSLRVSSDTSELTMLSISISDDARFNGDGDIVLLINEDENEPPSVFIIRERCGWNGSAEQRNQIWNTVMLIFEEV